MSIRNRTIAAFTGLLLPLATIGFAGAAQAQTPTTYQPNATTVTVNRTEVPAGGIVEVSGNASPNTTVTFSLPARVLGTAQTNNAGAFRAGVTIPCDVSGLQTLSTTGSGINATATLNVVGAVDACVAGADTVRANGSDNLPRTGSSSTAPLTAAGIGLVLIGAATAVTARRRRRTETV